MASNQKEVKVKVATKEELDGVEALELRIDKLQKQKIQVGIDIASQKLEETQARINELKQAKIDIKADAKKLSEVNSKMDAIDAAIRSSHNYNVNVSQDQLNKLKQELSQLEQEKINLEIATDDSKIRKIDAEIAQLDQNSLDLQLAIDTGELQKAKAGVEELDGKQIDVDLNMATQNFSQGLTTAKQGVQELYDNIKQVEEAGIQSEQNLAFLELNLGADKAKTTMQQISDIVAKMPGDDNTMRSVLSTAQALGNDLKPEQMEAATKTMADYMAGSATMGKMATESQQDIMKYLLDGNTAELERGSIVSSHVDKLKEANTFMERQAAMQEVLNELGYGGISTVDTMVNKQAEWEGMIYNSSDALSSMWLDAEKGAMDYILKLNDATNGLAGMGIVGAQMVAGPLTEIMGGISQIGMGFKTLKDAADFTGITSKLSALKDTLINVGTKAKEAAVWMLDLGKKTLQAGYNALKSAALWAVEKAALIAQKIATAASAAAQWLLNAAMNANPIMLIVTAIIVLIAVLGYLYFNNEQVRQAIDSLGQSFILAGQIIYTSFMNAINWIIGALQNFYNYVMTLGGLLPQNVNITGNQIVDSILAFLAFFATLPIQIGIVFVNILAKALGFGDNFVQRMIRAGSQSVSNFIGYISSLPGKLRSELSSMLSAVNDWAATLPQKFWEAGVNAVKNFLNALGIHSPGTMQRMLIWEISEMGKRVPDESKQLLSNVSNLGGNIVDSFGEPELGLKYEDTMNARLASRDDNNYSGDVIYNFNLYGDMDTEDRMKKFLDYVVKETHWNNKTAGRTI